MTIKGFRRPVLENPVYSNLLFKISVREVSASDVKFLKEVKKSRIVLVKQLKFLEKKGFLKSKPHPSRLKNIRLYFINWSKIIEEFLKFLNKKLDLVLQEAKKLKVDLQKIFKKRTGEDLKDILCLTKNTKSINALIKNLYLINIFKNLFSELGKLKGNYTIKDIFEHICHYGNFDFLTGLKIKLLQTHSKAPLDIANLLSKEPTIEAEIKKIKSQDKDLEMLHKLHLLMIIIRISPTLNIALEKAIKPIEEEIFQKYLT